MFTTVTALNAEIDYRTQRVRADWRPRPRRTVWRERGIRTTATRP